MILILLGLVHCLGHYAMVTTPPANDKERQLHDLQYNYTEDMGLGFIRGAGHLMEGFSLTFSLLSMVVGTLLLLTLPALTPALFRRLATVNAGWLAIWLGVALRYWFPAPISFIAAAWICMLVAVVQSRGN